MGGSIVVGAGIGVFYFFLKEPEAAWQIILLMFLVSLILAFFIVVVGLLHTYFQPKITSKTGLYIYFVVLILLIILPFLFKLTLLV